MSVDTVLNARLGMIVAPAGCGKTHLITEVLRVAQDKPYLVLTHTTAGVAALKKRLNQFSVPPQNYVVTTIDGWALRIAGYFPKLCPIDATPDNGANFYPALRRAILHLLQNGNVDKAIEASYSRLLVDEYQDCNILQHEMVQILSTRLPTVVFGDPMQCIFGFSGPMPDWSQTVQVCFPLLETLQTPWRWDNAHTSELGNWILNCRNNLLNGNAINLDSCPDFVRFHAMSRDKNNNLERQQQEYYNLLRQHPQDSILVLGDSRRSALRHQFAQRINGIDVVEPVDMSDVMNMARFLDEDNPGVTIVQKVLDIAAELMTNVDVRGTLRRIQSIKAGRDTKAITHVEEALILMSQEPSRYNIRSALQHLETKAGTRVYRSGACQVLKDALTLAIGPPGKSIYESASIIRQRRRYQGDRRFSHRSIGSTLLLKGLECDHALVLDASNMSASDLYVALSRGAKSITVFSSTEEFSP